MPQPDSRKRILAIDDNSINLAVMAELLGDDYNVMTAECGEEAVRVAPGFCPDLILLDIMMPGIDGYETCEQLRTTAHLESTKILLVSAKSEASDRLRGYESGADDFIAKPFNGNELLAKIKVFLRLKSAEEINSLKSDLLNIVTHELRTPLTGILPAAEILHNEPDLDIDERRSWTGMIIDCARRLHDWADDGLLLCQLKADGAEHLDRHPVSLAEILDDVVKATEGLARERQMQVVTDTDPGLICLGDRALLQTAFRLLLEHSIGFSTVGTTFTLTTRGTPDRVEFVLGNLSADLGGGDSSDVFVFPSRKIVEGEVVGAGIHMALVREVIRVHGGNVDLTWSAESGTAVEGWLPHHV